MNRVQILVVEDNSIVGKDIQKRLTTMGYAVPNVAATGNRALEMVEESKPDLVLMDIMLKGNLDGMETAQQMASKHNIPVVYLTAYSDDSTLEKAKATGAFGYLLKPFNETELHTTIELALFKHAMERKLRQSEQWLTTTINSIDDVVITTTTEGIVISMNTVAERLLGVQKPLVIGHDVKQFLTLIDKETRSPITDPLTRLRKESSESSKPACLKLQDGWEIPVEDRSTDLRDAEGNLIGFMLVFQDVSARRKAEDEINRLNQELQSRVNELTALNRELSTFNYSVSHDLRGPLIAIDGFTRLLVEEASGLLSPEGEKYLFAITKNTRAMLQTIDDLLLFARLSRSQLEKEDLEMAAEANDVLDELQPTYMLREIDFVLRPVPQAYGDRVMIHQVLVNLFSNSIKFTRFTENPRIEFGGETDGMHNVYFVRDNGVGFAMADAPHLFQMFRRLHSTALYEGSGVGLAIAQRIIERHSGRIWAEGKAKEGATFYFSLPRNAHESVAQPK